MKKRILSILLLCCMVLTLLPTTALAAETGAMDNIPAKFDVEIDLCNRTSDINIKDSKTYYTVSANSGGIAVSGTCSLYGMWEDGGIAVWIEQRLYADGKVLCYRTIRSSRDFKGGYNHFLTSSDLKIWSYPQLLETLSALRKDGCRYERAA